MKCIGGQIKAFSFLFCIACGTMRTHPMRLNVVAKCKKVERVNTQNDYKTTPKK